MSKEQTAASLYTANQSPTAGRWISNQLLLSAGVAVLAATFIPYATAQTSADGASEDAVQATATTDETVDEEMRGETIIVTGSRLPEDISTFPGTVSILGLEAIETQRSVSPDLGAILGFSVPSLGVSSGTNLNRDQTLRGRSPVVVIDGIPITAPLRNSQQDLRTLSSSTIERIEVIHGSSSLYGNGGAGGIVNYITRLPTEDELRLEGEVSLQFSATHPDDSYVPGANATLLGGAGNLKYVVSGSFEQHDLQFDSNGDGLPPAPGGAQPGIIQSDIYSLYGKSQLEFGNFRFIASALYFEQSQDPTISIQNGDRALGIPATFVDGRDERETDNLSNTNKLASLTFVHDDVLGSELRAQVYVQELESVFGLNLTRPSRTSPSQSFIVTEKWGLRTDIDTPIDAINANLVWGFDYTRDESSQSFLSGEVWAPPMDLESAAVFAQLNMAVTDRLGFRGGVRYEEDSVTVDDYTTYRNVSATGGELEFSSTVWNAGLTYDITDSFSVFGGFSEGSSVQDIGRILRDIRTDTSVEKLNPRAAIVESLEVGFRYITDRWDVEAAVYRNQSEFGTQLVADPLDPSAFIALQEDEVVDGAEVSVRFQALDNLSLSGTIAVLEGERDTDGDGEVDTKLSNFSIPPTKITAAADWQASEKWRFRLQAVYSGDRDPFPGATGNNVIGQGDNESFFLVDGFASYDVGHGVFTFGVQNLLNEDYFLRYGQSRNRDDAYAKGQGTTIRISYKFNL